MIAVRDLVELFDEDRALAPEVVDDVFVVDDFVAHVDRRAVLLERPFDDLDGPLDAGAEAARRGEQDFQFWFRLAHRSSRYMGDAGKTCQAEPDGKANAPCAA